MDSDMLSLLGVILGAGAIILVILLALIVVLYVLNALGLSYVLKSLGYAHPGFAWVPILNWIGLSFALKESDGLVPVFGSLRVPAWLLAFYWVFSWLLGLIPGVGAILAFVFNILAAGTVYTNAYARMENRERSSMYVIGYLSGFIGLIAMIKFLIYRSHGKKEASAA